MMLALLTIKRLEEMEGVRRLWVTPLTQEAEEVQFLVEVQELRNGEDLMGAMVGLEEEVPEVLSMEIGVDEMVMGEEVALEQEVAVEQEALMVVVVGLFTYPRED